MTEFSLAHPWMTFFLVALAIVVFGEAIGNIAKAILARRKTDSFDITDLRKRQSPPQEQL